MLRLARIAFALLAFCAADAMAQSRNGWPSPAMLARQFERVAFTSEFGGQYRAGRLIRWEGPITVRITGHVPDRFRTEVERQLAELRQSDLRFTPEVSRDVMKYALPLLADSTEVEGQFSAFLTTDGTIPLENPTAMNASPQ